MRYKDIVQFAITRLLLLNGPVSGDEILRAYLLPVGCHWLISVADTGSFIEIEDGSRWEIASTDIDTLSGWRRDDTLVITPDFAWFSLYDYKIINKSNNTCIQADLAARPLDHGPFSHWIVDIDYYSGHVYLENHMVWCVDPQNGYDMRNWTINDHIVLGACRSWFSPYDHVLINVEMDESIRVKQY